MNYKNGPTLRDVVAKRTAMANTQTTTLSQANCRKVFVQRDFSQVGNPLFCPKTQLSLLLSGKWCPICNQIPSWAGGEDRSVLVRLHHQHAQLSLCWGWERLLFNVSMSTGAWHVTYVSIYNRLILSWNNSSSDIARGVWLVWPPT